MTQPSLEDYFTLTLLLAPVLKGDAWHRRVEDPFDVSVPIGGDDRQLERPGQLSEQAQDPLRLWVATGCN